MAKSQPGKINRPKAAAPHRQAEPRLDDPMARFEQAATALFQVPKDEIAKKPARKGKG